MIYLIYNARSILKLKTTHMLAPMGLVPYSAIQHCREKYQ